nr:hypothetical protein CFP56_41213 [Quercus suber]
MTTLHRAWPANRIVIYTDIDMEPLAVEYLDGKGVADDGVGGDVGGDVTGDVGGVDGDAIKDEIDLESDYDKDDENDEEEDVEIGARDEE